MFKATQLLPRMLVLSLAFMPFMANAQTDQESKLEKVTEGQKPVSAKAAAPAAKAQGSKDANVPIIRLRYPIPVPSGWPAPISGSDLGVVTIKSKNSIYTIQMNSWNIIFNKYLPQIANVSWAKAAPSLTWVLDTQYRNRIAATSDVIFSPIMKVEGGQSQVTANYYCLDNSGADKTCDGNTLQFRYVANLSALAGSELNKSGQGAGTYGFIGCIGDTSDQVQNTGLGIVGGSRYVVCCYKQNPTAADTCTLK